MDYFVERAATDEEVHAVIRRKYGDRARILSRREVRSGGMLGLFRRRSVEMSGYCTHTMSRPSVQRGTATEERRKILESVRSVAERAAGDAGAAAEDYTRSNGSAPAYPAAAAAPETGAAAAAPPLDAILQELRSLRSEVGRADRDTHASLARMREVLDRNDFSPAFSDGVLTRLRRDCSMEDLEDYDAVAGRVVRWIEEAILVHPWTERARGPRVIVLVGPTGVGKTTTIAKLAAMYGPVAEPSGDVRILTIDSYRIGALHQLEKYGEIMNVPVVGVDSEEEMRKQLALNAEADYVFVDTVGKSPQDFGRLAEVNQLVRAAGGEVHLAISATTKRRDIEEILRQFEPFNYAAVVVTKLDETNSVGGVISALHEKRKSVSFCTDGQRVPQDISRARADRFLGRLVDLPWREELAARETASVLGGQE